MRKLIKKTRRPTSYGKPAWKMAKKTRYRKTQFKRSTGYAGLAPY